MVTRMLGRVLRPITCLGRKQPRALYIYHRNLIQTRSLPLLLLHGGQDTVQQLHGHAICSSLNVVARGARRSLSGSTTHQARCVASCIRSTVCQERGPDCLDLAAERACARERERERKIFV